MISISEYRDNKRFCEILSTLNGGDRSAFSELVDLVYDDIRRLAESRLHRAFGEEAGSLTLSPTCLAADTIMELRRQQREWANREHFFAIAARVTLRLAYSYRRDRQAIKRGKSVERGPIESANVASTPPTDPDAIELAIACLESLHRDYPTHAEVLTLRVICDHSVAEVAKIMGTCTATVERHLRFARAWIADRFPLAE